MNISDADRRNVLVGADPEVFVRNTDTGLPFAAYMMPGSKAKPFPTKYGGLQVDGCALEMNIHPAKTKAEFMTNLYHTQSELINVLKEKYLKAELAWLPLVEFDKEYFKSLPAHVKMLGCDPDYNAYTLEENESPKSKQPVRTAGGHIHVGFTKDADPSNLGHMIECSVIAKQLDACLFIPSMLWDDDQRRRAVYGRPGAFRAKEYGVEYRVLSNKWVEKPALAGWVYDATITGMKMLADGYYFGDDDIVQDCITQAQKSPDKFGKDRALHEDMYGYLVASGLPPIPEDCIQYTKMQAA